MTSQGSSSTGWKAEVQHATFVLSVLFATNHFIAAFGPPPVMFGKEGLFLNVMQGIVFTSAAVFLFRRSPKRDRSQPPRDEFVIQAIRERAVDNLIAAQRETNGGHA
jgi:hypothetical protein